MNWKKVILIILDTVLAVYLLFAVTSFNRLDDKAIVCSQVKIEIKDDVVNGFLNADEIKRLLVRQNAYPLAKPMADIDVRHIEEVLKTNPFISDAQSYKTQSGFVIISLAQRTPVLHIKADTGDDYYIDLLLAKPGLYEKAKETAKRLLDAPRQCEFLKERVFADKCAL